MIIRFVINYIYIFQYFNYLLNVNYIHIIIYYIYYIYIIYTHTYRVELYLDYSVAKRADPSITGSARGRTWPGNENIPIPTKHES